MLANLDYHVHIPHHMVCPADAASKFMQHPRQDETHMLSHMRNSQGQELMGQNAVKSLPSYPCGS